MWYCDGEHSPLRNGGGVELSMCDWRLCPRAKHGGQKRGKGKRGWHWPSLVGRLDTSSGFWVHGILGEDFKNRVCWKAKRQSVLFPPLGRGGANGRQGRPVSGGLGTQTLKDAWSWAATGDQLSHSHSWHFWVGEEVPGTTMNWTGRGWQGDFSSGVLEGASFEAQTCHYFQRPW